jgi:ABC-type transport system involved in cytochrome bd biosynthesis fused ATPase/permease subunit
MEHSGPAAAASTPPDGSVPAVAGGSAPRVAPPILAGLTALEALGRLSIPASVFSLSRGATMVAAATSAIALIAVIARGFAASFTVERTLRATFAAVMRAAQRQALVDLRAERKIGLLAEAAREAAVYEATVVPLIGAHAVAILATWAALVVVLGPLWALALVAAAAPLVLGLALGARRIRAEQEAAWSAFTDLSIDLRVLVEACLELRAHDREAAFAEGLVTKARSFARAERRANVWSAASAAIPAALVLVSAVTPAGEHIGALVGGATGRRAAEIAITSGAALHFALGLGKLLESRARYAPFRETLRGFLAAGDGAAAAAATNGAAARPASAPLARATVRFRDVSCRHPRAARATPHRVALTWPPGTGLVLAGSNGAGKTTLVLALLGLLEPSEGAIEIDGAPRDGSALRERCAYLAQSPFLEPGASVAWHVRLFARGPLDDDRIDAALRRVGLWRILEEHAARSPGRPHPRDVPAGELSGGERQRMHIARVLAQDADLIILDEPEAGLDHEARAEMAALFQDLAASRRVLLIAHDPTIVPRSFERLEVRAEHDHDERPKHDAPRAPDC